MEEEIKRVLSEVSSNDLANELLARYDHGFVALSRSTGPGGHTDYFTTWCGSSLARLGFAEVLRHQFREEALPDDDDFYDDVCKECRDKERE